eukprot:Phypoly_transcript_16259.p1 GENE.Phypoly_transcript_16259~~Phypoly_transcript_16259.p1  ORF type:complete len:122 (+),score=15.29 Phypoly_transcript_16259:181-546(+)
MCHVVSYFNDRLWQNAEYFYYHHILLFASVQDNNKHKFDNMSTILNSHLRGGRSQDLELLCQHKLSNFSCSLKPFTWYEPTYKNQKDAISSEHSEASKPSPSTIQNFPQKFPQLQPLQQIP